MSTTEIAAPSADEQPKKAVAKKVVTPKRRYFFPSTGISLVAGSLADAQKLHDKQIKQADKPENTEGGDGQ